MVFDHHGSLLAAASEALPQIFPQAGWVEHCPADIWGTTQRCVGRVLSQLGLSASQIAAVGITNQRETTLLWNRNSGRPLGNAVVWQDRRTAGLCDSLRARGLDVLVRNKTGLELDPYFSASKLAWMLDHLPGAREEADAGNLAFGTVDTWLVWNLTAGRAHITDVSNASRTMLFNIHTLGWDDELLALFNIPASLLPEVQPSTPSGLKTDLHVFGASVPIAGLAGDQQAATFGQACFGPGDAKTTYGTGCFMLANTGDSAIESQHRLLTTVGWQRQGKTHYMLEGSVFMGGAIVQWLRDGLGLINEASDIEALAGQVPDSDGVVLVPAFAGLGAPHWKPNARASLHGMTRGTCRAHIARAALDAIAWQVADLHEAMVADGAPGSQAVRVDGAASANNLLMQLQADCLGLPVVRSKITETTALGAAYLAGLATGLFASEDEIRSLWQEGARFEPSLTGGQRAERRQAWRHAISNAD